jgi:hypothetical protein
VPEGLISAAPGPVRRLGWEYLQTKVNGRSCPWDRTTPEGTAPYHLHLYSRRTRSTSILNKAPVHHIKCDGQHRDQGGVTVVTT